MSGSPNDRFTANRRQGGRLSGGTGWRQRRERVSKLRNAAKKCGIEKGVLGEARTERDGAQWLRLVLDVLSGGFGIVEHDIVGIGEVDDREPGLALLGYRLTTKPQPAAGLDPDHVVMEIAALGPAVAARNRRRGKPGFSAVVAFPP